MRNDHLLLWLSGTKPIVSIAIALLVERKALSLDDPVKKFVPAFAQHGKEAVTVRQILTHTGGFRGADLGKIQTDWEGAVAAVCASRIEPRWTPGEKAGYHSLGSWMMLGEIIRLTDGRMPDAFVQEEIFLPLEMNDCWLGIPGREQERLGRRIAPIYDLGGEDENKRGFWNQPDAIALPHPAANGRGPAVQLLQFYRMLLEHGSLNGRRLLKESTVHEWTRPQRVGMFDHTFRTEIDWGFGFRVNSAQTGKPTAYGFGAHASARAFGHAGAQSSSALADPEKNLALVILTNGRPGETAHQERIWNVQSAAYEDLGWV